MRKADLGRDTQKKTASKASEKSEVELDFDAKRLYLDRIQKEREEYPGKEAEFNMKEQHESSKVEGLRKSSEAAEKILAETKRLRDSAKRRHAFSSFQLSNAKTAFEKAGRAYTRENMRKFSVVNDGEEEATRAYGYPEPGYADPSVDCNVDEELETDYDE